MFGERLRELREEMRMTQEELGKRLNVSKQAIYAYEKGENEPSIDNLIKLADIFEVSLDYLLCRTKQRYNLAFTKTKDKFMKDFKEVLDKYM